MLDLTTHTQTTVTTERSVSLNEDQINAIVREYLAAQWNVSEHTIKGEISATDYGARCEGYFSYKTTETP